MAADTVEFSAKIPRELYDRFKALFPQYGAVNWFINTATQTFVDECEKEPSSVETVNRSVNLMLAANRGANLEV